MTESETLDEPAPTSDHQEATADEDDETCPNGVEWCDGGESDQLPCFACFRDAPGGARTSVVSADDRSAESVEDLSRREVRALTERLVILDRDAPGLFAVYSEEGMGYTVDIQDGGACTCHDVQLNDLDEGCKHQHAARFLAGDREIPSWVIRENVNAKMATTDVGEAAWWLRRARVPRVRTDVVLQHRWWTAV